MNLLTSIRTLLLALALSIGVSYAYAAWSPPSTTPTGGNTDAPVNVGGSTNNLSGYVWSSNIGWISFNNKDCDTNNNGYVDVA